MATGIDIDQLKKDLFKSAMKGEWKEVVKNYEKDERIHKVRITRSGGTALHIAVSDGQDEVVEDLVRIIQEKQQLEALKIGDERGSTPLHIAAGLGNVSMCKCIATADPKLIGERNHENETPFFLAALHGHKDAFLCLHYLCASVDDGYTYSRRNDGETILHCAISGDYLDLAFQIIHLYEKLVNSVNEKGVSPLHVLATKPNAFRSGSHLGRCIGTIYHYALKCPSDRLRKGQALNNLGSVYVDCGQLDLAADCYSNALKIRHTRAHQGLARVHFLKNNKTTAYEEMTKLIKKARNNASAYEKRSEYCDRELTRADLEMVTQLDPLRVYPYRYRAAVLMDSHKENEAIAELSRAIAFKADLHLLHLRAAFHEHTGDVLGALRDCRAALSVDPNDQEILELHSRVYSHEP